MTRDLRAAHVNSHREMLKVVIATSLVTCLELFDFTVFSYFAVMIGDQFFPATDPMTSLLLQSVLLASASSCDRSAPW